MQKHLALGRREDRALIFLMASCVVFLIAYLPQLAREAHLNGTDMEAEMGGAILVWLFWAPLLFYILGAVLRLLLRAVGCRANWYEVRLALFWSLLAATPFVLLNGLTAGLIGPGVQLQLVGSIWAISFLWILFGSLKAACKGSA